MIQIFTTYDNTETEAARPGPLSVPDGLAERIRAIRDSKTGRPAIFRFAPGPNGTIHVEVKGSEEVKRAVELALSN